MKYFFTDKVKEHLVRKGLLKIIMIGDFIVMRKFC